MKIALIQTQGFWKDPPENRKQLEQKIHSILIEARERIERNKLLG